MRQSWSASKPAAWTRNPQLVDPVAWLNLTLADERELDDVALHRSPGGRWFFQGWGRLCADRRPTAGTQHCPREPLFMPEADFAGLMGKSGCLG
jgi:hypothetical protein